MGVDMECIVQVCINGVWKLVVHAEGGEDGNGKYATIDESEIPAYPFCDDESEAAQIAYERKCDLYWDLLKSLTSTIAMA